MNVLSIQAPLSVEITHVPQLHIKEGTVLVEVHACGICGGDLTFYKEGISNYPYFGHEFSGVVRDVSSASSDLQPGDRVTTGLIETCGICSACSVGRPNFCEKVQWTFTPGGFAEQCLVTYTSGCKTLLKLPDSMNFTTATLHEPLSCALRIVKQAAPQAGDTVLMIGLGAMGVLSGMLLKQIYSVAWLVGVDTNQHRLKSAESLGFDLFFTSEEVAAGKLKTFAPGFDIVVDATSVPEVLQQAIDAVRLGGTVILAGVPQGSCDFTPLPLFRKEITVKGAKGPFPYMSEQGSSLALDLLASLWFPVEIMFEEFPVRQAEYAFQQALKGATLRTVITF